MADTSQTTPANADRQALARCWECFEDGQDVDIGRPALDRLTTIGWLDRVGRSRWQISDEGLAELERVEAATDA